MVWRGQPWRVAGGMGMLSPQLHVSSTEVMPPKYDSGQVPSRRGTRVHESLRDLAQNRGRKFPKIRPRPP